MSDLIYDGFRIRWVETGEWLEGSVEGHGELTPCPSGWYVEFIDRYGNYGDSEGPFLDAEMARRAGELAFDESRAPEHHAIVFKE
jgi:hypothetical protein